MILVTAGERVGHEQKLDALRDRQHAARSREMDALNRAVLLSQWASLSIADRQSVGLWQSMAPRVGCEKQSARLMSRHHNAKGQLARIDELIAGMESPERVWPMWITDREYTVASDFVLRFLPRPGRAHLCDYHYAGRRPYASPYPRLCSSGCLERYLEGVERQEKARHCEYPLCRKSLAGRRACACYCNAMCRRADARVDAAYHRVWGLFSEAAGWDIAHKCRSQATRLRLCYGDFDCMRVQVAELLVAGTFSAELAAARARHLEAKEQRLAPLRAAQRDRSNARQRHRYATDTTYRENALASKAISSGFQRAMGLA